jgi:hypothetical protein
MFPQEHTVPTAQNALSAYVTKIGKLTFHLALMDHAVVFGDSC